MTESNRAGFSLPELIIVVTLTAIILAATYGVLITNQRTYTVQNAEIQNQQTVRAAMEILSGELREVSSNGGDLLRIEDHALQARSLRKLGITCSDTDEPGSRLYVRPLGAEFDNSDTVWVFADNKRNLWNDDVWLSTDVSGVSNHTCDDGTTGQTVNVGLSTSELRADSVRIGAPIRSYATYDYYVDTWAEDGRWYLFRERDGTAQPLVGPLRGSDGVKFEYFDQNGTAISTPATNPAGVRRIRVTVATLSPIRQADGTQLRDSLVALIHPRN